MIFTWFYLNQKMKMQGETATVGHHFLGVPLLKHFEILQLIFSNYNRGVGLQKKQNIDMLQ